MTAAVKAKILPILIQRKIDTEDELLYDYNTEKSLHNTNTLDKETKEVKVIKSLKELIGFV